MVLRVNILILLIFIVTINLVFYSNSLPLKHEEPRRAIISQEMLFTNNFIIPKICQEPYYKKPPFHNWIIALTSIKDKYISNLDARLPSLISLILTTLLIFCLYRNINYEIALISSAIFLTSFSTMISYGIKAEPDMLFTLLFFASYFYFIKEKLLLSSLFMGASILTKGISPLFFYPGLLMYLYFEKDKNEFLKKIFFHFLLSLILPLTWLFLYSMYGNINEFFHNVFFEVKDRTISNFYDIITDALLFPIRAFLALFPWSIFIIFLKKEKIYNKTVLTSLFIFGIIFFILLIFPCGKGRYFLPAVPFFAILAGNLIELEKKISQIFLKYLSILVFFIFLGLAIFLLMKGYFSQSFFLIIIGLFMFVYFNVITNMKEFGVALSIFILLVSAHFFNFYRAKYMYNYHNDAKVIVKRIKNYGNYPIVVDRNYNKLRLLFNIEREYKMPLYRKKIFKKYFYMSTYKIKNQKLLFKKRVKNKILYFYLMNTIHS